MSRSVALFRCDASAAIGAGHVMRCLAFAETLSWAGWSCRFATRRESLAVAPALAASGHDVLVIDGSDDALPLDGVGLTIVDHYGLGEAFERSVGASGCTLVAFDDLADRRHHCDILVDPTPERTTESYRPYVPASARRLLGPRHAIVRREWREARAARRPAAGPARRIIVSMGATDPSDATSCVLMALAASGIDAHIDVVLGAGAPHLQSVAKGIGGRMKLHINPPDLPALTAKADLAIGAAGSSSFERAALGLPAVLIQLAENQRFIVAGFARAGAAESLPASLLEDAAALGARIAALAADGARLAAMSRAAASLTDGRGACRLLAAIAERGKSRCGFEVTLRLVEGTDETWLLDLQRQPATRRFARNPEIPSAEQHAAWFARLLGDEDRLLTIIESDGRAVGMIRFDKTSAAPVTFEISIALDQDRHGEGLGAAGLALVRRLAPGADLTATVLSENKASRALFAAAGYRSCGPDRLLNRAV